MVRRLIGVILLALLTACAQRSTTQTGAQVATHTAVAQAVVPETAVENASTEAKKECTVYVTRKGKRYHQGWCRSLRYSKIPMTRMRAITSGYTPCMVCGGSSCEN